MADNESVKSADQLLLENEELRSRLSQAEEALIAIRNGDAGTIVVSRTGQDQIFSLSSDETPYRILLEEMDEGALSARADGTILYCNNRFVNLISEPVEKIVGSNFRNYIADAEKTKFDKLLKSGLRGKANGVVSFQGNDRKQPLHLKLSIRALPGGNTADICMVAADVSQLKERQIVLENLVNQRTHEIDKANKKLKSDLVEIKKSRKALLESEKKLSSLYSAMSDGLAIHEVIYDNSGNAVDYFINDVNPAFEQITQLKKENTIGRKATEVFSVKKAPYLEIYTRVASTGKSASFETYFPPMNKYFQVSVFSPEKGKFATVFQDISERKAAEEKLKVTLNRFYLILSSMHNGILLITNDNRVEFINQRFCDLFDLKESPGQLLDMQASQIIDRIKYSYKDQDSALLRINELVKLGRPALGEDVEMSSGRTLLRDFIPITDGNNLLGRLWSHIDITERKLISDTQNFLLQRSLSGSGEDFFNKLARFLATILQMDYVCIDKLESDSLTATTISVFNDGNIDPNITYDLKETPCGNVVGETICCFPENVCQLFPNDPALFELQAESYIGSTLWSFDGKPIGLIAVIGRKPLKNKHQAEVVLKLVAVRAAGELERRLIEEALRQSEERERKRAEELATVLNAVPAAVWIASDPKGFNISGNKLSYDWLHVPEGTNPSKSGPEAEKLTTFRMAKDGREMSPPEMPVQLSASGKFLNDYEFSFVYPDGSLRHLLGNASPLFDPDGKPRGSVSAFIDITERKRTETELIESEKRFRQLVKNAPTAIWEVDILNKKITSVNDAVCSMSGYTREELLSMNIPDILDEESQKKFITRVNICLQGQKPEEGVEYNIRVKDGRLIVALLGMKYEFDDQGRPVGAMVVAHDITERKHSELVKEQLLSDLKKVEGKLNIALENGNIGLWEWDLETSEVHFDNRIEKMFGLQPGTFGKTFKAFEKLVNEEDISHFRKNISDALEEDIPFETIFRTRSEKGKSKYISSKAVVNKDNQGKPIALSGVCFDVTNLREGTEKVISKLNEELLRSNKELENFAYVASHDLQEPLRMVSSFTQLLERQYKDKLDDRAHEYIHYAVDGAKRMYELLNGLLAYSRINTKGKAFRAVNLNNVIDCVIKNLSLVISERNAVVKTGKLPVIFADESQVVILFQNLIANGIKFSTNAPRIYISSQTESNHYLFSVKDEGIGIETQYFDRIFLIFQRLMPKDQYEGTGIGLAICKRIIERHNGKIWIESEPGKGTTFFFTIPKSNESPDYRAIQSFLPLH
jgi:PAS domain S-box-containing protein